MPDLMRTRKLSAMAMAIVGTGVALSVPIQAQEPTSAPTTQEQTPGLDEMLLQEAIQRGIAEVEMARLAGSRAEAEPVRAFAKRMLEDHGKLNDRLIQTARSLNLREIPTGPTENEAAAIERLRTLEGVAFDQVYAVSVAQEHMRHYNLHARMAAYASQPVLRQLGTEAVSLLEQHQPAAQALRVDIRPIAQGPLGAVPNQTVAPTEKTPQMEQPPYSDEAEGAEP